ncbi:MAG: site-2 protease family protein [Actinomycetota bacterium]|nr:site-2 protease family protein [Actinomycetota bacterium]
MPRTSLATPGSRGFRALRIGPISVLIDPSWFVWLAVIAASAQDWLLHAGFSRSAAVRWEAGVALALLVSACVLLHELAHSLVALSYGLRVRTITLFLFGGVSHIEREAPTATIEYQIALIGPLTSLVLATIFGAIARAGDHRSTLGGAWGFASWVNLVLAVFNLLPAFPMDGGRVLRSILWAIRRNRARATHLAAIAARVIAVIMIVAAAAGFVFGLVQRNADVGYVWVAGIGVFLYNASSTAERSEGGDVPNRNDGRG